MEKLLYDPVIKICVILIMHVVRTRVNFSQATLILASCSLWGLEFLIFIQESLILLLILVTLITYRRVRNRLAICLTIVTMVHAW